MDESFNLCDFYNKINNKEKNDFKILQEYPSDNNYYKNYSIISNILFKNNHINSYYLKNNKILKLKNLYLINHCIKMSTFHSFPINIRNYILDSIPLLNNDLNSIYTNSCFITRGIAKHLPRNLDNQNEIENYLKNNNFTVINPELLSFNEFINNIRNRKLIILTWGSALVNLIFVKTGTKVIILKSKSYENESLDLFKSIIKNLDVLVINHNNNKIDIEYLNNIIN